MFEVRGREDLNYGKRRGQTEAAQQVLLQAYCYYNAFEPQTNVVISPVYFLLRLLAILTLINTIREWHLKKDLVTIQFELPNPVY